MSEQKPFLVPGQLIRLPKVCEALGVCRSTVYNNIKSGTFPKPVKLGERISAWRTDDIIALVENGVQLVPHK